MREGERNKWVEDAGRKRQDRYIWMCQKRSKGTAGRDIGDVGPVDEGKIGGVALCEVGANTIRDCGGEIAAVVDGTSDQWCHRGLCMS